MNWDERLVETHKMLNDCLCINSKSDKRYSLGVFESKTKYIGERSNSYVFVAYVSLLNKSFERVEIFYKLGWYMMQNDIISTPIKIEDVYYECYQ
jgi:hypothetical protein